MPPFWESISSKGTKIEKTEKKMVWKARVYPSFQIVSYTININFPEHTIVLTTKLSNCDCMFAHIGTRSNAIMHRSTSALKGIVL